MGVRVLRHLGILKGHFTSVFLGEDCVPGAAAVLTVSAERTRPSWAYGDVVLRQHDSLLPAFL